MRFAGARTIFAGMSNRVLARPRHSFIAPCLPSTADHPPTGSKWVHEIKHDGYRLMARRDPVGIRLLTRNGHDWADRYPLIVEAVNHLKARSCLIDGEAVCCDENGLAVFERMRRKRGGRARLPVRLRPAGAGRHGPATGAVRGSEVDLVEPAASEPPRRTVQRAPAVCRRHRLPARLQDGPGGDRLEAARLALSFRPVAGLAEVQEPGSAGGEAGGGGGLGDGSSRMAAMSPSRRWNFYTSGVSRCPRWFRSYEQLHRRLWSRSLGRGVLAETVSSAGELELGDSLAASTSAGALAMHLRTKSEHFIRCKACGGWIDCRDLAQGASNMKARCRISRGSAAVIADAPQDAPDRPRPRLSTRTSQITAVLLWRVVHRSYLLSLGLVLPIYAGSGRCMRLASQGPCAHRTKWRRWTLAKAEFEASWKQWKAWAGMEEVKVAYPSYSRAIGELSDGCSGKPPFDS